MFHLLDVKNEVIKMKLVGKASKEIMKTLNIKNPTQVILGSTNVKKSSSVLSSK